MFGYNQTTKNITTYGKRTSIRVYENIVVKDEWIEKLELQRLVDNIIENDLSDVESMVRIKPKKDAESDGGDAQ